MSLINLSNKPNFSQGHLWKVLDPCGTDDWDQLTHVLSQAGGQGRVSNVIPGADLKAHPRDPLKVSC